jgi:site-specific DNA-methyltransferase (adenine-specific)
MSISTKHLIINGDSRNMTELSDNSVNLIITSPPYWQLKDYGSADQIGFNDSYENYINNLNLVWQESHRVLENGCRLCVNIGDQFARAVYYGRYKVIPIRTEIIKFCEIIGFDYMGAIIWQKKTTTNTTGGASIMGSFPYPRNGILSIDYEFILLFKKLVPGGRDKKPAKELKEQSKMTKEEWKEYFSGHWNFGGAKQDSHIAMFPEELPQRLIKMFSFIGDTVLDPFLGSGTTSLAAKNLGRNSVGYEINSEFLPYIKKKLNIDQTDLLNTQYKFVNQKNMNINYNDKINESLYIFKDSQLLDKKIDPKKLQFGSKIDKNSNNREEYYSVKDIISTEILVLNNGLKIRLLGIKEDETQNGSAHEFIQKKVCSQKVYLKYDEIKYDTDNILFCYLYLKNKTFINAHLIKHKLAFVDTSIEYRYKNKFLKLRRINNE